MKDHKHPIWPLFRFVALLVFIIVFSWINASKFDETEAKMITAVMSAYGATEFALFKLAKDGDAK